MKQLKRSTLYNEDCLNTMARMPEDYIDLVVTSPPYDNVRDYKGYTFDFEAVAAGLLRTVKGGGVIVWVVDDQTVDGDETGTSFKQALFFKQLGFKLYDTMIYHKSIRPGNGYVKRYIHQFEYMFVFSKHTMPKTANMICDRPNKQPFKKLDRPADRARAKDGVRGRAKHVRAVHSPLLGKRTNVWSYRIGSSYATDENAMTHPAVFPERLAGDHIQTWSNEGDLVYDPFMGSGTVAVMCEVLGREWIGSEISKEYCEIAEQRINRRQR